MLLLDAVVQKAEGVVALARERKISLSCAESCTGGLVGAAITSVAGSSEVFQGGIISYSNDVKHRVLGVDQTILDTYGAVSEECARAMAEGAARVLKTQVAVSITGIAGPDGGVPGKPVGTVWFGIATPHKVSAKLCTFNGSREVVRTNSVLQALDLLHEALHSM